MKEFPDLYKYEKNLKKEGYKKIAGCDEAGRGSLIGPVYAAAVILNPLNHIEGINDSKKLTANQREKLYKEIKEKALSYAIEKIEAEEIDQINIYEASRKAMEKAVLSLKEKPDFILTDAMPLKDQNIPFLSLIHGDALSASIGAASILAKVERDHYLIKLDEIYPLYHLKDNKGYATKFHKEALKKYGITPLHRKTYRPVKEIIEKQISLDI